MALDHLAFLRDRVAASVAAKQALLDGDMLETAAQISTRVLASIQQGGKVFFFGNGGSAMDAGHLAAELLGRFYRDRAPLGSIALSDNTAAMTAIGNDYAYDEVFARQIAGLGRPGDVAIGMTTSGNSGNVVKGLQCARGAGLLTVAFTGAAGSAAATAAEFVFRAPSTDTPRVQEIHMAVGHTLCEIIERELFPVPS